jgi:hypothetical protein
VTRAEIIYQRRLAVLDYAARVENVAEACRVFGISRTRYYEWKGVADRYGLAALKPKDRRAPQMPEATPTHVIEALLTLAVTQPSIGCRQYADRLGDQGADLMFKELNDGVDGVRIEDALFDLEHVDALFKWRFRLRVW